MIFLLLLRFVLSLFRHILIGPGFAMTQINRAAFMLNQILLKTMDFDRLKVDRNNRGAARRSAPVVRMTPVVSPSRRSRRSKSSNVKVVNQPQL